MAFVRFVQPIWRPEIARGIDAKRSELASREAQLEAFARELDLEVRTAYFRWVGGDVDCAFWDAVYIASFPAFIVSMVSMVVLSLATQKRDVPMPITDVDGNAMDTNPFHHLGITSIKDAFRKMKPEEYDK